MLEDKDKEPSKMSYSQRRTEKGTPDKTQTIWSGKETDKRNSLKKLERQGTQENS